MSKQETVDNLRGQLTTLISSCFKRIFRFDPQGEPLSWLDTRLRSWPCRSRLEIGLAGQATKTVSQSLYAKGRGEGGEKLRQRYSKEIDLSERDDVVIWPRITMFGQTSLRTNDAGLLVDLLVLLETTKRQFWMYR